MAMIDIKVPDIGDFDEVAVIELLVKPGDTVRAEQSLITVESDKASMEIPSSHAGVVKELKIKLGDKVKEGSVVLVLDAEGAASAPAAPAPAAAPEPAGADDINFVWPAQGTLVATFDEAKNKGVSIAGRVGDAVVAAADGRVVYAGAGLRGYGNLIILKHNNTYLTAYAHNQALLVREDQAVKQGQKIAEMGSSDTDRVKLHFEVRRQGKPVDPLNHLPKR